jgi:hypothetical protein
MDHVYIEEHGLIDLYHRGALPPEEEAGFEEHFVGCSACQERLEMARGFQRGLKTVVAEDAARASVQAGLLGWIVRRRWRAAAALALAAVLPVLGYLVGTRDTREAMQALAGWRQRAESGQRSASELERKLAESERRREEERRELEGRLARAETPAPLPTPSPLVNTPVFLLTAVRGEPGEPAATIDPGASEYVSLAVDAGDDPRFVSYRATVTDARGARLFRQGDLKPNALEAILLTFPASFFQPGNHRLALEGIRPDSTAAALGSYLFRVVP